MYGAGTPAEATFFHSPAGSKSQSKIGQAGSAQLQHSQLKLATDVHAASILLVRMMDGAEAGTSNRQTVISDQWPVSERKWQLAPQCITRQLPRMKTARVQELPQPWPERG